MAVAFREAGLGDLPAICGLGNVINRQHHEAWPHIFAPPADLARDGGHWRQSIGAETATTFLAEDDGVIVGFVTISYRDESHCLLQRLRYAQIGSIVVSETHRRRGLGKHLVSLAEGWGAARGAKEVRLNVWAFNEAALRLYRELGYDVRAHAMGKTIPASL